MDDMDENLTGDETCEEGIDGYAKFVSHDDQLDEGAIEYLDMDMEMIQEADDECHSLRVALIDANKRTPKKRQRSKESKLLSSLQSSSSLEKKPTANELKLRPKYRPIRPKPISQINAIARANKLQGLTPIVNFNAAPGFIVAAPSTVIKKEKGHETFVTSPVNHKGVTYSKVMTNGASLVAKDSLLSTASTLSLSSSNDGQNGKVKSRNLPKSSVELFFDSMAKTVLNLPTHIQAEIKMEICRVVTMAEIKYLSEHTKNVKND